jgi:chromosome segregation ATPase
MTENQEKKLFNTLATLVTGVRTIQSDVQVIQSDVQGIKKTLNEHSRILNEHSRILNRLDAKTDSIAETVMTNDKRLTAVEKDVSNLRGEIH